MTPPAPTPSGTLIIRCEGNHPRQLRVFHSDGRRECQCGASLPAEPATVPADEGELP